MCPFISKPKYFVRVTLSVFVRVQFLAVQLISYIFDVKSFDLWLFVKVDTESNKV